MEASGALPFGVLGDFSGEKSEFFLHGRNIRNTWCVFSMLLLDKPCLEKKGVVSFEFTRRRLRTMKRQITSHKSRFGKMFFLSKAIQDQKLPIPSCTLL